MTPTSNRTHTTAPGVRPQVIARVRAAQTGAELLSILQEASARERSEALACAPASALDAPLIRWVIENAEESLPLLTANSAIGEAEAALILSQIGRMLCSGEEASGSILTLLDLWAHRGWELSAKSIEEMFKTAISPDSFFNEMEAAYHNLMRVPTSRITEAHLLHIWQKISANSEMLENLLKHPHAGSALFLSMTRWAEEEIRSRRTSEARRVQEVLSTNEAALSDPTVALSLMEWGVLRHKQRAARHLPAEKYVHHLRKLLHDGGPVSIKLAAEMLVNAPAGTLESITRQEAVALLSHPDQTLRLAAIQVSSRFPRSDVQERPRSR